MPLMRPLTTKLQKIKVTDFKNTYCPPSHSAIFSFPKNSSSSFQHRAANVFALDSRSSGAGDGEDLKFVETRSPVEVSGVKGGALDEIVSEYTNEPVDGARRTERPLSRLSSSCGTSVGSELEAPRSGWTTRRRDDSLE